MKKTITHATKSYAPKQQVMQRKKRGAASINFQGAGAIAMEDPPPITEDDINKGMMGLLNKGIIPKDVDLTPAFEKGAPPVTCKAVKFYDKEEKVVRRDV